MTAGPTKRFPLGLADLVREPRRRDGQDGRNEARTPLAGAKPGAVSGARAAAKLATQPAVKQVMKQAVKPVVKQSVKPVTNPVVNATVKPAAKPVVRPASGSTAQAPAQTGVRPAAQGPLQSLRPGVSSPLSGSRAAGQPVAQVSGHVPNRSASHPATPSGKRPAALPPAGRAQAAAAASPAGTSPRPAAAPAPVLAPADKRIVGARPTSLQPADKRGGAVARGPATRPDAAQNGGPRGAGGPAGAPAVALNGALALTSERVRERMVERVRANGVTDPRVLQALATVPRHMFVDPGLAAQAYEEAALPIGHHQTISKPSVVARMLELALAGRVLERVLEIGTGCGYQAAVLSRIARDVYSIERIKPLYERAKTNLRPLRIPNIRLHYGDGRLGLPSAAPFDAIVIAAAGFEVPQALLEQLAIGGRLVAPVAESGAPGEATQVLTLVERTGSAQWRESRLDRVFFVPLKSGVI